MINCDFLKSYDNLFIHSTSRPFDLLCSNSFKYYNTRLWLELGAFTAMGQVQSLLGKLKSGKLHGEVPQKRKKVNAGLIKTSSLTTAIL